MSLRGIFSGALALIALQAVLSTDNSANRVGSGLSWIADLVSAALDPSRPAIPDLAGGGFGGGSGSGFTGGGGGGGGGGDSIDTPDVIPGPTAVGGEGGGGGGGGSW